MVVRCNTSYICDLNFARQIVGLGSDVVFASYSASDGMKNYELSSDAFEQNENM